MITAADFVKWINVFGVVTTHGGGPISFPLSLAQGGTGQSLSSTPRGLFITDASGNVSIDNNILITENLTGLENPGKPALKMINSVGMTYPSVPFSIALGLRIESLMTTSQTINSGGISVANALSISNVYDGSGTNDLSTFNPGAIAISFNWSSSNTVSSMVALNNTLTYRGSNVGGRTSNTISGSVHTVTVNPYSNGVTTINLLRGNLFQVNDSSTTASGVTGCTKNITTLYGIQSLCQVLNSGVGNISNITNFKLYDSSCTLNGAGAGSQVNITNFYGLHLQAPTISGTVNITNRYGIKQDDASASNVFAGIIQAPSINFGGGALANYIPQTSFTPVITCTTPGDLSVSYTTQQGQYSRIGNLVHFSVNIAATITYTTASGTLNITGLPINSNYSGASSRVVVGGASYSIPANLTGYSASISSSSSVLSVVYLRTTAGSALGLPITQFPSGNAMIVQISGFYFAT